MVTLEREYDLRQFQRMLERLQWYREGSLNIGVLLNDLGALDSALRNPTGPWKKEFGPTWGTLEEVYAVMLDKGRAEFNQLDRELVDKSVDKLWLLVQHEIANLLYPCWVCGLKQDDPPWGEDGKTPSFDICRCCGTEFGYEDATPQSIERRRQQWIAEGMPWRDSSTSPPPSWDPMKQLKNIGVEVGC